MLEHGSHRCTFLTSSSMYCDFALSSNMSVFLFKFLLFHFSPWLRGEEHPSAKFEFLIPPYSYSLCLFQMSQSTLASFWFLLEHHINPSAVQESSPSAWCMCSWAQWHHPELWSQVLFFPACLSPALTQEIDQRHSDNEMILNVFPYMLRATKERKGMEIC